MSVAKAKRLRVTTTIDDVAKEQSLKLLQASKGLSSLGIAGAWVIREASAGRLLGQSYVPTSTFKGIRRDK
ncbi:MAG: hypothetical protein K0R57_3672 [Paenibacillaceae bacterium]|jgi:hypothetical protein|nr:hypothetical protein [Paenibacillaceae bacterium]